MGVPEQNGGIRVGAGKIRTAINKFMLMLIPGSANHLWSGRTSTLEENGEKVDGEER